MTKSLPLLALFLGACGGGGGGGGVSAAPVNSSPQAVSAFMKAAADSNLVRMAELWGTSQGAVSITRPANYEKRLVVMQAYLHGDSTRVLSDAAIPGDEKRRQVAAALYRGTCIKQIPFTTVRTRDGWIVEKVNVSFAGNPARPCDPGTEPQR